MHLKRSKMPKTWPIPRKGTKYIAVASHAKTKAIPLVFVIRDLLKIARTRKEARYMILNGDVKINNKVRKNGKFPLQVFDTVSIEKSKKNYRLIIVNKKFNLQEISEKEAIKKVVKIVGKRIIKKGKIQINLEDGSNFLTKEKFNVSDSAVINHKENKIEKILELKEGANIEVVSGKHAGEMGKLKAIEKLERRNVYLIKLKDKEVTLPLKTILVIE